MYFLSLSLNKLHYFNFIKVKQPLLIFILFVYIDAIAHIYDDYLQRPCLTNHSGPPGPKMPGAHFCTALMVNQVFDIYTFGYFHAELQYLVSYLFLKLFIFNRSSFI